MIRASFAIVLAAAVSVTPAMASRVHRAPTSGHSKAVHHGPTAKVKKMHGQQAIDPQRVTAIQQALIREHYLNGEPSSKWDGETQQAMLKFQADQGWQTRLTPDSRALIKLGLGPNHAGAINASEGVNFNSLGTTTNLPATQVQGFIAGSGVSH